MENVREGVIHLKPGDHALLVFTGKCGECGYNEHVFQVPQRHDAGTTFLILVVPLIIKMDRGQPLNELEIAKTKPWEFTDQYGKWTSGPCKVDVLRVT